MKNIVDNPKLDDIYLKYEGRVAEFIAPSGSVYYVRELNGDDESIISNTALNKQGKAFNLFISSIVVAFNNNMRNPTYEEVMDMRIRDKYAILIFSRIQSLGSELRFQYTWPGYEQPTIYVEDLNNFIADYSKPVPKEGEPGYFAERIAPYEFSDGRYREIQLSSKKEIRYLYSNGYTEKYMLDLSEEDLHRNSELYSRKLSIKVGNDWVKVEKLSDFSIRDLQEIRKDIKEFDRNYNLLTEISNPRNPFEKQFIPIVGIEDFFFQEAI
jgi:hypothetical protein